MHYGITPDFFTIHYSGRDVQRFVKLLEIAGVATVVDVRDTPTSQYKPEFNSANLKGHLNKQGLNYFHRGDLGVPREIRAQAVGKNDRSEIWEWYDAMIAPNIADGSVKTLDESWKRPVAFMCLETDPTSCHRHRLILALERCGLRGFDL